jgi:hypothetical protein
MRVEVMISWDSISVEESVFAHPGCGHIFTPLHAGFIRSMLILDE